MRFSLIGSFIFSFLLLANGVSFGQKNQKDSSKVEVKNQKLADDSTAWLRTDTSVVKKKKHSPRKATLLSTFVPGLGQVYNRQYWKVPIIGGLGVFFGIMIASNHHDYKNAKEVYRIRKTNVEDGYAKAKLDPSLYDIYDENGPANAGIRSYSTDNLRTIRDSYRRDRDYFVILSAVVYALNIVDAAVFAHLREFEVNENLSMRIDPDLRFANMQPMAGLTCRFYLK